MEAMTNLHHLADADAALSLLDRARSSQLAALTSAELAGRSAPAGDLRVVLAAVAAEADALFEVLLRDHRLARTSCAGECPREVARGREARLGGPRARQSPGEQELCSSSPRGRRKRPLGVPTTRRRERSETATTGPSGAPT
jgi:hypothetical protein